MRWSRVRAPPGSPLDSSTYGRIRSDVCGSMAQLTPGKRVWASQMRFRWQRHDPTVVHRSSRGHSGAFMAPKPYREARPFSCQPYRSRLLADQFLKLSQILLDHPGDFLSSAFSFKIGIVSQFALRFFGGSFCIVKIAFNLLLRAVCHCFPRTRLPSIRRTPGIGLHVHGQQRIPGTCLSGSTCPDCARFILGQYQPVLIVHAITINPPTPKGKLPGMGSDSLVSYLFGRLWVWRDQRAKRRQSLRMQRLKTRAARRLLFVR